MGTCSCGSCCASRPNNNYSKLFVIKSKALNLTMCFNVLYAIHWFYDAHWEDLKILIKHFIEILLTRQEGDIVGSKVIHGHLPPVCDVEDVFVLSIKHTRPRPEQNCVIHEDCSSDLQAESRWKLYHCHVIVSFCVPLAAHYWLIVSTYPLLVCVRDNFAGVPTGSGFKKRLIRNTVVALFLYVRYVNVLYQRTIQIKNCYELIFAILVQSKNSN